MLVLRQYCSRKSQFLDIQCAWLNSQLGTAEDSLRNSARVFWGDFWCVRVSRRGVIWTNTVWLSYTPHFEQGDEQRTEWSLFRLEAETNFWGTFRREWRRVRMETQWGSAVSLSHITVMPELRNSLTLNICFKAKSGPKMPSTYFICLLELCSLARALLILLLKQQFQHEMGKWKLGPTLS